jgi:hypothetical protein
MGLGSAIGHLMFGMGIVLMLSGIMMPDSIISFIGGCMIGCGSSVIGFIDD